MGKKKRFKLRVHREAVYKNIGGGTGFGDTNQLLNNTIYKPQTAACPPAIVVNSVASQDKCISLNGCVQNSIACNNSHNCQNGA
jgi:hypothetical protein